MKEETLQKIMLLLIAVMSLYYIYSNIEIKKYLENNVEFTIGKAIKYSGAGGTARNVSYIYYVNNKKFIGGVKRDYDMISPLMKFYKVKYSKIKPEISHMYLDKEIKDSVLITNAGFKYENR